MPAHLSLLIADVASHPGDGFRKVLPFVLGGAVVLVVLHLIISRSGRGGVTRWNWWEKLLYLATVASIAVLGVTSFGAMMRFGILDGWILFAHMFGAGALVAILPLLSLTWCEANRFGGPPPSERVRDYKPRFFWFSKAMFWTILAGGLVVTMTMLLSMLPLFGTDGLQALLAIHRYAGLVVVIAVIFHLYSVLRRQLGAK